MKEGREKRGGRKLKRSVLSKVIPWNDPKSFAKEVRIFRREGEIK